MNAPARLTMSRDRYLDWEKTQERKHELVEGEVRSMAGGTAAHNAICANLIITLGIRLKGKPCRAFGSDMKVAIPNGNMRYPDVVVDCGKPKPTDLWAAEPRVIIEVLSPSTEWFDQTQKLEEYQSIASVAHVAFLSQNRAFGRVWSRAGDGWTSVDSDGVKASFGLAAIDLSLPLSDVYDGVEFAAPEN
ncbi:MAG: Uma2 family endonuclease [Hyphomonadaceae bacterium]|nr:Uma2 family endonuclease [Hyphomonadaceae bacterium]